jgi:hypothetical protein
MSENGQTKTNGIAGSTDLFNNVSREARQKNLAINVEQPKISRT